MNINKNILYFHKITKHSACRLIIVSKNQPIANIELAYQSGHRLFGESKVQELVSKHNLLPSDMQWQLIGHLQRNKVKYIAPFIHMIQSVDSLELLHEIDNQAKRCNRIIPCLLQVHIANEDTKFGFDSRAINTLFLEKKFHSLPNIRIEGLMGMATHTDNQEQIRQEFKNLKMLFDSLKTYSDFNISITELSMGMSSDYQLAIDEGSTFIRIGTSIFGEEIVI